MLYSNERDIYDVDFSIQISTLRMTSITLRNTSADYSL
jgi:hypothetical protein